eukprot:jgi/Bigna1/142180/aug1.67_g16888
MNNISWLEFLPLFKAFSFVGRSHEMSEYETESLKLLCGDKITFYGVSYDNLSCYYSKKEAAFALTMGRFWTNMGATGNPNCRTKSSFVSDSDSDSGGGGDDDVSCYGGEGFAWPVFEEGSEMNIILEPKRAPYTPESMLTERYIRHISNAVDWW